MFCYRGYLPSRPPKASCQVSNNMKIFSQRSQLKKPTAISFFVYVQNRVSVNEISSLKEALNVVPWETDGESVLREACPTRASFHDLLLLSSFIVYSVCLLLLPYSNFKRWQQKMFFHLGTLNLAWFLNETAPQLRMERLNLGNSPTANIKGKGDVIHIWKRVSNSEYFLIFADGGLQRSMLLCQPDPDNLPDISQDKRVILIDKNVETI
ncbi:hypothetical protein Tco_0583331 [Tanacetum coccineum]